MDVDLICGRIHVSERDRPCMYRSCHEESACYSEVVSTFQRGLKLGIVSVDANAIINEMVGITDPTVSLDILCKFAKRIYIYIYIYEGACVSFLVAGFRSAPANACILPCFYAVRYCSRLPSV
jgi:hypothetical protein